MRRLVLLACLLSMTACGGSSSETPPPLEPDPARLRGDGEAEAGAEQAPNAGAAAAPGVIAPVAPARRQPAPAQRSRPTRSTWGTSAPRGPAPELAPEPEL